MDRPRPDGHWRSSTQRVRPGTGWGLGFPAAVVSTVVRRVTGTRTVNLFTTLGRDWRLFGPWLVFASQLMPFGVLPRVDCELVILRVAWNCRCRYEWEHHMRLGRRAGLDDRAITRVQDGPGAAGWSPRQAAILAAVDELHTERTIGDATWDALAAHLDDRALIELCMLVGHYEMLAMTINALGIQVDQPTADRQAVR